MKNLRFAVTLFFVLLLSLLVYSCKQEEPRDDQLSKKVQALESKVDSLQKRLDDQRLKTKIASSLLFQSPLEQFFNAPEFWENTYDTGQADCSNRCIKELQDVREQCSKKTDANERLKCFNEASERAANCHTQCAGL